MQSHWHKHNVIQFIFNPILLQHSELLVTHSEIEVCNHNLIHYRNSIKNPKESNIAGDRQRQIYTNNKIISTKTTTIKPVQKEDKGGRHQI